MASSSASRVASASTPFRSRSCAHGSTSVPSIASPIAANRLDPQGAALLLCTSTMCSSSLLAVMSITLQDFQVMIVLL